MEATADEGTPLLPRDLNNTNEIIRETLNLLLSDLDTTTGQNKTNLALSEVCLTVYMFEIITTEATVIFEALDNILSESNQASFDSLQEVGVGSQAVLRNAESFGLFAARVLAGDGPGQLVTLAGKNTGADTVALA